MTETDLIWPAHIPVVLRLSRGRGPRNDVDQETKAHLVNSWEGSLPFAESSSRGSGLAQTAFGPEAFSCLELGLSNRPSYTTLTAYQSPRGNK